MTDLPPNPLEAGALHLQDRLALRPRECANALGVSERTLRKWMRDENLPYIRVDGTVLIPTAQLAGWMEERLTSQRGADDLAEEIIRSL